MARQVGTAAWDESEDDGPALSQDCATGLRDGLNKTPGTIKANHHRQGANGFCCATCGRHNRATYLWFVQRDETLSLATGLLVKLGAG